ncbi:MAG: MYXO-CTERM sorting domain-containing protein, partial [Deltaproteobacteria bacterium]|nr:MYXO-CTERM sorting domain-containing protein [Deltaproteobacteria bacterium]
TWEEDPHIWYSAGTYHIIYSGSGDRVGYHLYSPDGINDWKDNGYGWSPREYKKIFCYEGSTVCNAWYKMERPSVVLENGHPTHATWAVSDVDKDFEVKPGTNHGTKIVVIPFDGVAFDNDFGVGGSSGTGGTTGSGGSSGTGGRDGGAGGSGAGGASGTGGRTGSDGGLGGNASGGVSGTGGRTSGSRLGGATGRGGMGGDGSGGTSGTGGRTGGTTVVASGGAGGSGGSGSGGVTTSSDGGTGAGGATTGSGGQGSGGSGSGGRGGGQAGGDSGSGGTSIATSGSASSGCACAMQGRTPASGSGWLPLLGFVLLPLVRRRRSAKS